VRREGARVGEEIGLYFSAFEKTLKEIDGLEFLLLDAPGPETEVGEA
jgi:hypothetical protein